ncbi:MAG: hypothetical protein Q4G33_13720 [bacterium]|nr:hypothetical protein [bacterium]
MDFYIMNCDTVAAEYKDGKLNIVNKSLVPLFFFRSENVEKWLEIRAIDSHRANSRLLKKALRMSERDDVSTVLAVNAVTITDNYWIKPFGSQLLYKDVRFDNDYFAKLALTGSYDSFNRAANRTSSKTPELTNIGSFEKCWKLVNGEWWMYKKANHDEMFSELFIYQLGVKLRFNMAEYKRGKGIIKTKDFTDNASVNFEPAFGFMGDNEDYIETLQKLRELNPDCVGDYVRMLFLDTICANPDRHTFNFGVLRDSQTGAVLRMSPNFDNNMALISRGYPRNIARKNDLLVSLFNELIEYEPELRRYIPDLNEDIIGEVLNDISMRVRSNEIVRFIMNGYNMINK